jgi:cob(I)alamin adenosyltransferase
MPAENSQPAVNLPPDDASSRRGLVQVYTGPGKGKTTAALGLAMRAAGHGWRVHIVQFMKGADYGEVRSLRSMPNISLQRFGGARWIDPNNIQEEDRQAAEAGMEYARRLVLGGQCDLLILDEVNVAMAYRLIQVEAVLRLLDNRPANLEIVLTGRDAPAAIIEAADLVTRMEDIKHPYRQGLKARAGIEY